MKVYKLRLIMGKATNYDQEGKLKNHVMTVKYAGELELENILEDQNWKKLGACEISCVDVYDHTLPSVSLTDEVDEINYRIIHPVVKSIPLLDPSWKAGENTVSSIEDQNELLKKQNALLMMRLDRLEKVNNPVASENQEGKEITGSEEVPVGAPLRSGKEYRESLFAEAKELNLNPAKNVKTDILKDLIANAKKERV